MKCLFEGVICLLIKRVWLSFNILKCLNWWLVYVWVNGWVFFGSLLLVKMVILVFFFSFLGVKLRDIVNEWFSLINFGEFMGVGGIFV